MSFQNQASRGALAPWLKTMLSGGCAAAALMASSGVLAQSSAAPQAAAEGGLEEIVVTAQRRAERLENVPMAVTALTSGALERAQVQNMHELGRLTPGVQINFGGVSTQPAIRGVTSLTNGTGNENNIAIYVDGFYVSDNITINQDLANLQSIQVLKGPQGTLYGRNATGGAILIQTMDPTKELSGKVEGSYGRFSEKKLIGYLSGPINDKLSFMVAGAFRNSDGWLKKTNPADNTKYIGKFNPQKQRSLRTKLKAELSDDFTATLAYNYGLSSDTSGNQFTPLYHVAFVPTNNLKAPKFGTASGNYKNIAAGKSNEATLKLEWSSDFGKLTSYTGYSRRQVRNDFDFDGTYQDISFNSGLIKFKTFQQSADYAVTAIDRLDLVVGGMYFNEKLNIPDGSLGFGANRALTTQTFRRLSTEAYAFYADATYHLTDKLSIGAGGRYSHDNKGSFINALNGAGVTLVAAQSARANFSKFTPRATVRYELASRTNIYASYSQGFRAGSYNATGSTVVSALVPIKPENIKAYEIGFKTAQRMFRFEAAGFYYDYRNLNVALTTVNPLCAGQIGCGPTTITGNVKKAKVKGFDASLSVTPVDKLNITVGGAYLHARYGSFPNAVGTGLNAATGFNATSQTQNWSGKQMARAPKLSANLSADYSVPVADGQLRLSGNVKYTTSYVISNPSLYDINIAQCPGGVAGPTCQQVPGNLLGKQRYRQPSYTLVDGEITWYGPEGRYWIGAYGKNLTNKSYRLTYNGSTFGDYSTKAQPISYGVKVGYKF